ncbi:uncharacterized protein CCOS01_08817 [Colletotrichum costaricense]|uniref:Uncharacterized protein n=1 Tax=Colletotrichum costaricense TaxID=1209916 RepID=A0AAI9YXH1_9PEZI|nr:uncharacterized protein CCOS01_08817 [Colletotrichum costaricense]KAK1526399.1 hypothetical protein CCOS01_08817 [Colletotrichum costaricense]
MTPHWSQILEAGHAADDKPRYDSPETRKVRVCAWGGGRELRERVYRRRPVVSCWVLCLWHLTEADPPPSDVSTLTD